MKKKLHTRGFTFIEVLVVIAILFILVAISITTFQKMSISSSHRVVAQEIFSTLTTARNDTLASNNDTVYGVHFETGSTTLFQGSTFTEGDIDNVVYEFLGGTWATSTFITNNTDVVFKRLTGFPSATGTLYIVSPDGTATRTITIHDTGLINN